MLVVGMSFGIAHACGRATGIISNRHQLELCSDVVVLMGKQSLWRFYDGLLLALASGGILAYVASL
jgi:hypothetical protein